MADISKIKINDVEYDIKDLVSRSNAPTIGVEDIDGGHRLTITDAEGTQIVDVPDGKDGISPTVEISKVDGVTTLTVTDAQGAKKATINDGTSLPEYSAADAGKVLLVDADGTLCWGEIDVAAIDNLIDVTEVGA